MSNLNTPQRLLLAAAGLAILSFQLYKFSEDGIEGTGWVFAIIAGVALLLPSLGLLQKQTAKVGLTSTNNGRPSTNSQQERVMAIYTKAVNRAQKLHRQLPMLCDFPPLQEPSLMAINQLMTSSWMQYCLAYSGVLALMAEWKRDERFPHKLEYRAVWKMIVEEMVRSEASLAEKHGLLGNYDPSKSHEWAKRDMSDAELAMKKFAGRLASNIPDPDAPIVDFLMDKMQMPQDLRGSLGLALRKFTKETLQEFMAT